MKNSTGGYIPGASFGKSEGPSIDSAQLTPAGQEALRSKLANGKPECLDPSRRGGELVELLKSRVTVATNIAVIVQHLPHNERMQCLELAKFLLQRGEL